MKSSKRSKPIKTVKKEYCQVITTVAKQRDADKIVDSLLKAKLVACVQVIGPIRSSYWWKGKICKEKEFLILAKTVKKLYPKVELAIKRIHPYEVPEIISMPIFNIFGPYGRWMDGIVG